MCNYGQVTKCEDPANELARLWAQYVCCIPDTNANNLIRKLIKEQWPLLKRLAHAVHDEETDVVLREQRKAKAMADDYGRYRD